MQLKEQDEMSMEAVFAELDFADAVPQPSIDEANQLFGVLGEKSFRKMVNPEKVKGLLECMLSKSEELKHVRVDYRDHAQSVTNTAYVATNMPTIAIGSQSRGGAYHLWFELVSGELILAYSKVPGVEKQRSQRKNDSSSFVSSLVRFLSRLDT